MLHHGANGQTVYEITLYNEEVRSAIKDNRSHAFFSDHWAEFKVRGVLAQDEREAQRLVAERYPPADGFVVQELAVIHH